LVLPEPNLYGARCARHFASDKSQKSISFRFFPLYTLRPPPIANPSVMENPMTVEFLDLKKLVPYARNPRITAHAVDKVQRVAFQQVH
jgi:hypothetical protein